MTTPKLSLLWITENYYPNRGGMAQSCDRISHQLRQEGAQVHILYLASRKSTATKTENSGGSCTVIPLEENIEHSLNMAWLELSYQARTYSHVVAFGGFGPMLAGPLFAQWLGLPLLVMLRGNDFDTAIFSPRRREVLFYALAKAAAVASVSTDKLDKIAPLFPNLPRYYTPNGIDLDDWQLLPSHSRIAQRWRAAQNLENRRVIGLFGHLKAKKGLHFFLQALAAARAQAQVHLLITGEIEDEETASILAAAGLPYTLLPFLDRHELLGYYPACDAVAIPSFYDGMPNVLLEAGALGLPFIAANVAGMRDFFEREEEAFLFAPAQLAEATNAIRRFLNATPETLQNMGNATQKKIRQQYTHHHEAQRYLALLADINAQAH